MTTRPPNVLLITVDTLRADHLGSYGYQRPTSPEMDAIAADGTLFEQFFCSAIPTQPSYTTLYTGQHPITHGVVGQGGDAVLSSTTPVLPELFLKAGYTTSAFDTLMRDRIWFGRGYEYYIDPSLRRVLRLGVTCDELNQRAIPWMQAHAEEPFFMFMHYWDPHAPYVPPERYRNLFYSGNPVDPDNSALDSWWEHPLGILARETWLRTADGPVTDPEFVVSLYDQEIRHIDDGIGALVDALDSSGLAENTLVMILGDHGESMTEHGIFFEHHGLYDCVLRVPVIVRWPGKIPAGTRLQGMYQMHDIAPTLLDAVGLPVARNMDGISFWDELTGQALDTGREEVFSLESTMQAKWCLRTSEHKLIVSREPDSYGNPEKELYDLVADPQELNNIYQERPDVATVLEDRLEGWIKERLDEMGETEDPVSKQGVSLKGLWG
ncbi:MAG: sulfatase [Chloroflexota bacterium]|nr:sulfatase [Chloroflexota bacterium]